MNITKKCNQCKILKSHEHFFKDKSCSDGRYSICKPCKTKNTLEWRSKNQDLYNASMRAYNKKHRRRIHLSRSYKITVDQYNEMLQSQKMRCAICDKLNMAEKRPLAIDHSHITGKIRGLLCYGCNRALSTLEKPGLLQKAMDYLLKS